MAAVFKVRECRHGLWPILNAGRARPPSLMHSVTAAAGTLLATGFCLNLYSRRESRDLVNIRRLIA